MSFLERDEGQKMVEADLETETISRCERFTIELGLGQDAPADGESIFPVANMEG